MNDALNKQIFEKLAYMLSENDLLFGSAESCSGGLFADSLTDIAGSSVFFDSGIVCYSNEAKKRFLGVTQEALVEFGAVSSQVAEQMALGAIKRCGVDVSVSLTGIAGPTGGSKQKPVGLVYIGIAYRNICRSVRFVFRGARREIKVQAVNNAALLVVETLEKLNKTS